MSFDLLQKRRGFIYENLDGRIGDLGHLIKYVMAIHVLTPYIDLQCFIASNLRLIQGISDTAL